MEMNKVEMNDELMDQVTGGSILPYRVQPGDTPEVLQRRVMEQAEWKLLPKAVELVSREIVAQRQ